MIKKLFVLFSFVLTLVLVVGCTPKVTPTIAFGLTQLELQEGEERNVTPTLSDESVEIVWESSDASVVTVANGTITAIAEGTTTITATIKDTSISASISVTVVKEAPTITLLPTTVELEEGEEATIQATLSDTTLEVDWTSSAAAVATVSNGVITAVSEGTATITATIIDTSITATVSVSVTAADLPTITLATIADPLYINETLTLTPTLSDNALVVLWSSSDANTATVANGVVTPVAPGTVTITATIDGTTVSATTEVTIATYELTFDETEATIKEKETFEINFTLVGKDTEILWTTSNSTLATVANGIVTAKKPGTVTITGTIINSTISASLTLTIEELPTIYIEGDDEMLVGTTLQLTGVDTKDTFNIGILWETSNPQIATVSNKGVVTALKTGDVTISVISLITGNQATKDLTVGYAEAESVTFSFSQELLETEASYKINVNVVPFNANPATIWSTSDETIATIDENGFLVTTATSGFVTLTGRLVVDEEITMSLSIEIKDKFDPIKIMESLAIENIIAKEITVTGYQYPYQHDLISSVHKYFFTSNTVIESFIPVGAPNRPGQIGIPRYVTIHDTGSSAPSADEHAHDRYVRNTTSVSWHYTVGEETSYFHLPENERAWHAGDGSRAYGENDSGILATGTDYPYVRISDDGYFTLNNIKSLVLAPMAGDRIARTSDITENGIRVVVGSNGNWFIGNTYWNSGYAVIANAGGNQGGIGIEMSINQGSDIYTSFSRLAKLTASIMVRNNFNIHDVRQHNFFSGKNCPQTMRQAGMWEFFLEMVEAEHLIQTKLKGYVITFTSNNPLNVDNRGRIILLPTQDLRISYTINVQKGDYNESVTIFTTLPAASKIVR